MVGDDIEVRVLEVKGNQVRIGIQAPKDVEVLREELVGRQPPTLVDSPTTED